MILRNYTERIGYLEKRLQPGQCQFRGGGGGGGGQREDMRLAGCAKDMITATETFAVI